jgi:hypothetical protein
MGDGCAARHGNGSAVAQIRAAGGVTEMGRLDPLSRGVEPRGVVGSRRVRRAATGTCI